MNRFLTVSAALLALGLSVPAQAADMPVKYVAPAPVFTWTGCYVGVHIGYKWGQSKQSYGGLLNGVPNNFLPFGTDLTDNYDVDGPVGGAQGGCNYADFGTLHYGDEPGIVNGCANADVKMSEYIWRVGMNYRFDWATFGKGKGKAPAVVAKY